MDVGSNRGWSWLPGPVREAEHVWRQWVFVAGVLLLTASLAAGLTYAIAERGRWPRE